MRHYDKALVEFPGSNQEWDMSGWTTMGHSCPWPIKLFSCASVQSEVSQFVTRMLGLSTSFISKATKQISMTLNVWGPIGLSPFSHETANGPGLDLGKSNPQLQHIYLFKIHFIIFVPLTNQENKAAGSRGNVPDLCS